MEDKIIFKGEFAYQFRLDIVYERFIIDISTSEIEELEYVDTYEFNTYGIDPNINHTCTGRFRFYQEEIPEIIDINTPLGQMHKYHMVKINRLLELCSHYLIALESSSENKVHYQGILWSKEPLELSSTLDKIKQKFFPLQKTRFKQNSVSLTQAKKIRELGAYVKKDKRIVKTNMNESQIAMLPLWKTKEQLKEKWNNKLIEKIQTCNKDCLTAKQTANILVEYCWENSRMHPTRARMQYLLGKYHNNYGSENIVIGYRLFPDTY